MRKRASVLLLSLILAAALQTAVLAEQTVPLAFKFAQGDAVQYDVTISGSASLTARGDQVTPVTIRGSAALRQAVTQVFPDGSGRIETRIPSGEFTITLGKDQVKLVYANNQVRWYANGQESMPPQGDLTKVPLIGTPLVYTMTPTGLVKDIAIPDPRMMGEMAKALPQFDFAAMQSVGEAVFPDRPVGIGETWRDTKTTAPMGPQYPIVVTSSRTLDSYTDTGGIGLAKIVGVRDSRFSGLPPTSVPGQDMSVAISGIRHTLNSTEFFNTTSGRLMRGDYDVVFSSEVGVTIAGQQKGGGIQARLRVNVQSR